MDIRKALAAFALALSGALAATHASAQFFLGGSIGQSDVDDEITTGLIDSGSVDGKDSAWKIFGGYMFNRHFGIEAAYINAGEVSYSGTFSGFPVTGGKVELTAFNVSVLGNLPINEQFSVFGKVGLFSWEAEASDITGGFPFSGSEDGTDISFGVGVGYNFTPNFGVRAEYELFQTDNADASLISIGLVWRF
ncbi:MAG TPA: outer membrane beta-barrel protein [Burkholderiales bacterium]|nr:outer membrane beta-barrel protein [Burkholderiales bacterium]